MSKKIIGFDTGLEDGDRTTYSVYNALGKTDEGLLNRSIKQITVIPAYKNTPWDDWREDATATHFKNK